MNSDPGYDAGKWATWTGASLDVYKIPGDHYTILRAPNISVVADVLAKRMAQLSPNLKAIARSAGNTFTADEQAQPAFTMSAETRSS